MRAYVTQAHLDAVRTSVLLRRGSRLSVQPCDKAFYEAVVLMGQNGGWDGWTGDGNKHDIADGNAPKSNKRVVVEDEAQDGNDSSSKVDNKKKSKLDRPEPVEKATTTTRSTRTRSKKA